MITRNEHTHFNTVYTYLSTGEQPSTFLLFLAFAFYQENFWVSKQICAGPSGRALRCRSAASHLLGLRVRIMRGAWTSVSYDCFLLFGRDLCVGLITRPEAS